MSSAAPSDRPVRDSDRPARSPDFLLEQVVGEYQLRHRGSETAVYINASAALLWELCDGSQDLGAIKALLRDAYPGAGEALDTDVDEALAMLHGHGAIQVQTRRRPPPAA